MNERQREGNSHSCPNEIESTPIQSNDNQQPAQDDRQASKLAHDVNEANATPVKSLITREEQISTSVKGKGDDAVNAVKTKNFKIQMAISGNRQKYLQSALLDTECGLCLIRRSIIRPYLAQLKRPPASSKLASANGTPIHVTGTIPLRIRLGDLNVTVCFCIVDDLAVPMLIGTSCQRRYIDAINPRQTTVKPISSGRGPYFRLTTQMRVLAQSTKCTEYKDACVYMCAEAVISARSQVIVRLCTAVLGIKQIRPLEILSNSRTALLEQGIMEVLPNRPSRH